MQFLKTLFWVALAVVAVIFSYNNWSEVQVALWGNKIWFTKLPVPLLMAFLAGLIPALLLHSTTRWSLKRKIDMMERSLSDIRTAASPAPTRPAAAAMPPGAAPMAVPPGVA